ncbi:CAP domain-containing protein [Virgibacillus kekensis]|uniref:CAP domain-containing protein n=1 Tax=Virgibacillus kekensis TaxID=202261 RepID=A0ABV9DL45_9BACI
MKKINKLLLCLLSIVLITLAACGGNEEAGQQEEEELFASSTATDQPSDDRPNTRNIGNRDNENGLNEDDPGMDLGAQTGDEEQNTGNNEQNREFPFEDGDLGNGNITGGDNPPNRNGQNQDDQLNGDRNRDTGLNEFETQQGFSEYSATVVKLTNQQRRNAGLSELKISKKLSQVARKKSMDMNNKDYFSHNSPTYGSPFDMMQEFNVSYQSAGENIARGQQTPQQVVGGWMDSPGHRANILNENFTHIGVGYVEDGNYWTQMFIQKK